MIGTLSEQESAQSSIWRELMAVSRSIDMLKGHLNSQCVKWCTDNKNVTHILEVGSRKPYLHRLALDILEKCDKLLKREAVVKLFLPPFGCDSVRPPYVVVDSKLFLMTLSFYFRAIL